MWLSCGWSGVPARPAHWANIEAAMMLSLSRPGWRSYLYALWAITLKDWRHFWRYPLNALSQALQPLIWLTPIYFMGEVFSVGGQAKAFAGYSGTADYVSFILI